MEKFNIGRPPGAKLEPGVTLIGVTDETRGKVLFLASYYGDEGSVAFCINRRIPSVMLSDILPDISPEHDAVVFDGGPVASNTLHVLHTDNFGIGQKVVGPVMWGGNYEIVQQRINSGTLVATQAKLFLGYYEYKPGELERDVSMGMWHVVKAPAGSILSQKDPYKALLLDTGTNWGKFMSNMPRNADLN